MRERLTYANVTATIALFLALGLGGAYAASKITSKDLAKSAVTSKIIKNKTIKGKDVKDKTLTGADYKDGSVASADIADATIAAADLAAADAPVRPTLGNGIENDCIWNDGSTDLPGTAPVSYRMNAFGEVSFEGIADPVDGPGGDASCTGGGAEGVEDLSIFALEQRYRPSDTKLFIAPGGNHLIFVVGVNGLNFLGLPLPAGTVLAGISETSALNEVHYLAASAPSSPEPAKGPARITRADLRELAP